MPTVAPENKQLFIRSTAPTFHLDRLWEQFFVVYLWSKFIYINFRKDYCYEENEIPAAGIAVADAGLVYGRR